MANGRSRGIRGAEAGLDHTGGAIRARQSHLTTQRVEIEACCSRAPAPARERPRSSTARLTGGSPRRPAKRVLTAGNRGSIPRLIGAGRGSGPGAEPSSDKRAGWPAGLPGGLLFASDEPRATEAFFDKLE